MSTHNLDVSGARALTTRTNDPASTFASTPAKAGDDVTVTVSGSGEFRMELPASARIQRRRYPQRTLAKDAAGQPIPDPDRPNHYVYEDAAPVDRLILVLPGGISSGFFRCSQELVPEAERASYEGTPHTSIIAKRWKEPYFSESGELVEEVALSAAHESWEESLGRIVEALRTEALTNG